MIVERAQVEAALPGYDIGPELGRGGFGLVLAGRHRRLARPVAIKILTVDVDADDASLARFAAEAQILANIDHPHVVRVYDYLEAGGLCLIMMEQLPGGTMRTRAGRARPAEAVCAAGLAVAEALGCAHAAGVLHRDIKPGNILLAADGTPKVTDFGIAKIFEGSAGTASAMVGTWTYMAPEQWQGGRLEPATDVYALGVVLYELLTGAPPFSPRLPPAAMMTRHLDVTPPPPAGVPAPVAAVILRALAKAPADRPASARAFAVELARAAAGAFGPAWLARSEVPLLVGDEVRDAARPVVPPSPPSLPVPNPPQPRSPALPPLPAAVPPATQAPEQVTAAAPTAGSVQPEERQLGAQRPGPAHGGGKAGGGDVPAPPETTHARKTVSPSPGPPQETHPPGPEQGRPRRRRLVIGTAVALATIMTVVAVTLLPDGNGPAPPPPATAYSGPTAHAQLGEAVDVAVDAAGNLYIGDDVNHRVQRITPDGEVTTVAGTGEPGFSGDDGPATQAQLASPDTVAVDAAGNLYIPDDVNHCVRRVTPDGRITTVAGTGEAGFSGDGGPATRARLDTPVGVAVDGVGTLYIADWSNHRVRRVDTSGRISTVAGTGEPGFSGDDGPASQAPLYAPPGVAVDAASNLYIADLGNNRVRRVTPDGRITTVAGTGEAGFSGDGGPATRARLNAPIGVAVDAVGNLYISDRDNHRVRRVDTDGRITTVAGTGTQAPPATTGWPPRRSSTTPALWRWTPPATSTSGNLATVG